MSLMWRRAGLTGLLLTALAGCSLFEESDEEGPALPPDMARRADGKTATAWPLGLSEADAKKRIAQLLPGNVRDRAGWATDLYTAYKALEVPHAAQTYCAAIAIIEQESSFQADPVVPGLPAIVGNELECHAGRYGVPKLIVNTALKKTSPDGKTYDERIDALKTE